MKMGGELLKIFKNSSEVLSGCVVSTSLFPKEAEALKFHGTVSVCLHKMISDKSTSNWRRESLMSQKRFACFEENERRRVNSSEVLIEATRKSPCRLKKVSDAIITICITQL